MKKGLEGKFREKMENFRYGRFNLIENNFYFSESENGNLKIENFNWGNKFGEGDCFKLCVDYIKENTSENFLIVKGKEPSFFKHEDSSHFYLAYMDKIDKNFWSLDDFSQKEIFNNSSSFIVDPSFKKILPFKDSSYMAEKFYSQAEVNNFSVEFELDNFIGFPLGFKRNKELVFLGSIDKKPVVNFYRPYEEIFHDYIYLEETNRINAKLLFEKDLKNICSNLSKNYVNYLENFN